MSVRKRKWTTRQGMEKEAWVVDYVDQKGERHIKTFPKKKDADKWAAWTTVDVHAGAHVPENASVTVAEAGEKWISSAEAAGLERATIQQYRQHLDLHISPLIGGILLPKLSVLTLREFEDKLRGNGRSSTMIRKVMVSLGSLLGDAHERNLVARNVVRDLRRRRPRGKEERLERRQKGKLKVGVDVPTREEIKAIVQNVAGRWRPLLITGIFTGLRASELRGLKWPDVDLKKGVVHVHQRADKFNAIGKPKSEAGERFVPLTPIVINTLREWKLECPKGKLELVFPNGEGNVENLGNIIKRGFMPTQLAAGVTVNGKAKYTGMHVLRHFYASWCINQQSDGGLGLPPKVVQERLGHSSITLTMDIYGHLFPRGDDTEKLAAAERALLG